MNRKSNRKAQAAELRSTWMVIEAREPGRPFRRKDIEDAGARYEADRAHMREQLRTGLVVRAELPPLSRRVYLPALARTQSDKEADQVPTPK